MVAIIYAACFCELIYVFTCKYLAPFVVLKFVFLFALKVVESSYDGLITWFLALKPCDSNISVHPSWSYPAWVQMVGPSAATKKKTSICPSWLLGALWSQKHWIVNTVKRGINYRQVILPVTMVLPGIKTTIFRTNHGTVNTQNIFTQKSELNWRLWTRTNCVPAVSLYELCQG